MNERVVKRYDPEAIETRGSSQVMAVMTEDAQGYWVRREDYDALHQQSEAQTKELEAARGLLREMDEYLSRRGDGESIHTGSKFHMAIDAFLSATPAPEAQAEQGERQEAVAWKVVGVHEKHRHPHVVVEHTLKLAEGQAAHWRNRGCSVEVIPLYTTPQPGPDVRALAEALERISEMDERSVVGDIPPLRQTRAIAMSALAAHRRAQRND